MIKIIAGGKKHLPWAEEAIKEYEKRLKKPYDLTWEYVEEEKLNKKLSNWPFSDSHIYDIILSIRRHMDNIENLKNDNITEDEHPLAQEKSFEEHMKDLENEKAGLNASNNIYREIAREALMNWNGLSEEEANEKAANSSVEELENQIGASGSIKAAVEGIANSLPKYAGEIDQEELLDVVFNQDKDTDTIFKLTKELAKVPAERIEDFTLDVLSDIHNHWIEDNTQKFFDEKRADRRYQFMPLEAIGYKEATADLLFLKPILESAKIEIDDEKLKSAYEKRSEEFMNRAISRQYHGYTNHNHIIDEIAEESHQLNKEIMGVLSNTAVDDAILSQLKEHNPAVSKVLENWGYGKYENVTRSIGYVGDLDNGVKELNKIAESRDHPVVMDFNGHPLKSGMSIDEVYLERFGKTKAEFDADRVKRWQEEQEQEARGEAEYKKNELPGMLAESAEYIPEEKMASWKEILEKHTNSYDRYIIKDAFKLIKVLDNPKTSFEEASKAISDGHSGSSFSALLGTVVRFSDRGPDFYLWQMGKDGKEVSPESMETLASIIQENDRIKAAKNKSPETP